MSENSPVLRIAPVKNTLATCTPYLMPFHISYAGPAPISTYFRVKPAPPPTYGTSVVPQEQPGSQADESITVGGDTQSVSGFSQSTLVATSSSATLVSSGSELPTDTAATEVTMADDTSTTESTPKRFVAAFRGRTVQGLQVDLPKGYSGIVLRAPDEKGKDVDGHQRERERPKRKGKGRGANKKNVQRAECAIDVDAEELDGRSGDGASHAFGTEETDALDCSEDATRTLRATSTFSSFVLWSQDNFVDEGKDEYLRSLTEWTRLAAEIHRTEDEE